MKKKIFILISVITFGVIIYLGYYIFTKIHKIKTIEANTQILPHFSFYKLDSTSFSNTNLPDSNSKIIINFFSPSCEHCQYMASQYLQHKVELNSYAILMVTVADNASTKKFYTDYNLKDFKNIFVLRDLDFQFPKIFGSNSVPSFFIYKDNRFVKKIIGETKIQNLLTEY